jgi:hypothetical protein
MSVSRVFAFWFAALARKAGSGVRLFANTKPFANEVCEVSFANVFEAVNEEKKTRRVMLAPYGEWPNRAGLQKFEKADAEAIVRDFNNPALNVLLPNEHGKMMPSVDPSRMMGIPWFIGHPDHDEFRKDYPDKKAYGRIKSLEALDDGLYANVRFGSEGERLVADEAFSSHSVNWYVLPDKKVRNSFRPYKLKSVGFTNFPNIPVAGVTTANEGALLDCAWANDEDLTMAHFKKLAGLRLMANSKADFSKPTGETMVDHPIDPKPKAEKPKRFRFLAKMRKAKT